MSEGLMSRVGRIVSGSVNAIVDQVENAAPAAIMAEAIREVDAATEEVRRELNRLAAQKHLATKRLAEVNREHEDLSEKVALAVGQDRDDLAKSAIARQIDLEAQVPVIERAVAEASEEERELRGSVEALLARRREMEARLDELKRTATVATAESANPDRSGAAQSKADRAADAFDRAHRGAAGLGAGLNGAEPADAQRMAELDKLARDHRIEERLAALKK